MKPRFSFLLFLLLLCFTFPVSAEDGPRILADERSYDPCSQQTGRDLLRCEARQQEIRDTADASRALRSITSTSSRVGFIRLRSAERERRAERNAQLAARRPTVQSVTEDTNVNTRRVEYLQQYKLDTLACMSEKTARIRSRCLEQAKNGVRAKMKAQRGTLRYYENLSKSEPLSE